jgi:hypothetical protein
MTLLFYIIGEGTTEPNDKFITQLVDNAEAANAIDAGLTSTENRWWSLVWNFMTANLLTF